MNTTVYRERRRIVIKWQYAVLLTICCAVGLGTVFASRASAVSPGGVNPATPHRLWLRADTGTSCSTSNCGLTLWNNQLDNTTNATGFNNPTLQSQAINFNPSVRFSGSGQYFQLPAGQANYTGGMSATVIGFVSGSNSGYHRFFDFANGPGSDNIIFFRDRSSGNLDYAQFNAGSRSDIRTTTNPLVNDMPGIYSVGTVAGNTSGSIYKNGAAIRTNALSVQPRNIVRNNNYIGRSNYVGDAYFGGQIAEMVVYSSSTTAAEKNRIDSYLAAKYGITLDQTTPQNYTASDGTTLMWNSTAPQAANYSKNITMVGRDDESALNQKQSRSVNAGSLVTVGHGNTITGANADNTHGFAADKSFMSFGDNDGALNWTTTGAPANRQIVSRSFKVQETGTVGSVKVSAASAGSTAQTKLPLQSGSIYLLTDSDGDFSSGATSTEMTLESGNWVANADFTNGQYFTFATNQPGFTVTPFTAQTIAESSSTNYSVVLNAKPSGNVAIGISSSDTGATQPVQAALTFTPSNWNTPQSVTVNGVNDVDASDESTQVTFAINQAATSSDYDPVASQSRTVQVDDDDTVGVTVTPIDSITSEDGDTGRFSMVLNTPPSANVTIPLSSSNTGEGTVQSSATFTPSNWNTPQTILVTGVDDNPAVADGAIAYTIITGAPTSTDSAYAALTAAEIADVAMENQNNDPPGIVVETVGTTTSEAGATVVLRFRLLSQPTAGASVTIPLSSSDTTEGVLSANSITITAANWNTPSANQITVTGVDDQFADGNVQYQIITGDPTSADPGYDALTAANVSDPTITNTENDVAALTVSKSTMTVAENGGSDTFTVVLAAQPSSDVNVLVASNASGEATVSPGQLTFTPTNWNIPRTVTVTGVDDQVDRNDSATIIVGVLPDSSADEFDSAPNRTVAVTLTDNDVADLVVTPSSLTVQEGGTQTFTVVLGAQPTGAVNVSLASSDSSKLSVSNASLLFTQSSWNSPRTITVSGLDDDDVIDASGTITVSVDDANSVDDYDSVADKHVAVTVDDTDLAEILVQQASLVVAENGGSETIQVALSAQPSGIVRVVAASSTSAEATVSPAALTFTTSNWNVPQSITVTGVNDQIDRNDSATITLSVDDAASVDEFDGAIDRTIPVTLTDDDTADFVLTPATQTVGETSTGTVGARLSTQPTSNVVLMLSSSDTSAVTLAPTTLSFTPANWNTAQTVTATAVDDADTLPETVTVTAVIVDASSASEYGVVADKTATVTTIDNDTAGVTLSKTSLTLAENGGTDTLMAVLSAQPSSDVVVTVSSANAGEATVAPGRLTFTPANWNTPQTATVTGVDDQVDRDDMTSLTVAIDDAASANEFDAVADQTVAVTLTDDDSAGLTVAPTTLAIDENGDSDSMTVRLSTQPTSDVTIAVSSSDSAAAVAGPSTLTFTPANWNTPQTVTVTGQPDSDSTHESVVVTFSVDDANSADEYDAVADSTASVAVNDLDAPGIVVTPQALTMSENGGKGDFTVRLSTQPASDVTVTLTPSANGEATLSQTTLTFTPANWDTPQVVSLTAIDDTDHATSGGTTLDLAVAVDAAASSDEYDAVSARTVTVTLTDDDGPADDADGDGISNADEALAPGGDGNGDGTPDSRQSNVATRPNPVTGSYTTLVVDGPCSLAPGAFDITPESANARQDQAYEYPVGLNHFTLNCANPGDTATLTFFYDTAYETNAWDWRKYTDLRAQEYLDMNTFIGYGQATVGSQLVTTAKLTIQDGSPYDQDGQRNGSITDPSGPAQPIERTAPGAPDTGLQRVGGNAAVALVTLLVIAAGVAIVRSLRAHSQHPVTVSTRRSARRRL